MAHYGERGRPRRDRLTDVGFATIGQLLTYLGIALVVGGLLTALDDVAREDPLLMGIEPRALRTGLEIGFGLLVFELMSYAYHRAAHRVPWLWRLHSVHHSSERMDWLASFRQNPLEIVLMTLVQNAPLVLLGVPLGAHVMVLLLLRLNTVFVHANLRLPGGWVVGAGRHASLPSSPPPARGGGPQLRCPVSLAGSAVWHLRRRRVGAGRGCPRPRPAGSGGCWLIPSCDGGPIERRRPATGRPPGRCR